MKKLTLSHLFVIGCFALIVGCAEEKPQSVTEGLAPSAIEEYQANEKRLMEETQNSMDTKAK
ncbi:hypothetical protein [Rubripirellula reticaptiva]|uniref:hypothetical protein n=1 Tax=Rubripirellula reticaptiva TaxID=2528013 RepID=UPI0011B85F04|nr:hypothetical protein [Rubripirellula reticaptiva]